jgi:hypothetical protein
LIDTISIYMCSLSRNTHERVPSPAKVQHGNLGGTLTVIATASTAMVTIVRIRGFSLEEALIIGGRDSSILQRVTLPFQCRRDGR